MTLFKRKQQARSAFWLSHTRWYTSELPVKNHLFCFTFSTWESLMHNKYIYQSFILQCQWVWGTGVSKIRGTGEEVRCQDSKKSCVFREGNNSENKIIVAKINDIYFIILSRVYSGLIAALFKMKHFGASQVVLVAKNPPANAGDARDVGSIPGLGRSPGVGSDNPLASLKSVFTMSSAFSFLYYLN